MFETSVIRAHTQAARGRMSLLTVSILAHSAVIVGVVAAGIASVEFPAHAPAEFAAAPVFVNLRIPPPLGNPNGGAKPQQPQQPAVKPPAPRPNPNQLTAPSTMPETIPTVEAPAPGTGEATGPGTGTEPGPKGVPWGEEGSLGDLDAPPAITNVQPVQEKIYEAHEVKAPVGIHRPHPPYPQILLKTKMRATVVVRCIIDKNGNVRDAQIIVPDPLPPFNAAVLDTVQTWRFTPGSLNGQAVETYLNLTVNFAVK